MDLRHVSVPSSVCVKVLASNFAFQHFNTLKIAPLLFKPPANIDFQEATT